MSENWGHWYNESLVEDLAEIVDRATVDFRTVGAIDLVLTGATGFVGRWLSLSYLVARRELGLRGRLVMVARNPPDFLDDLERIHLADDVSVVCADVRHLDAADLPGSFNLIHAATPARASLNSDDPSEMFDIIVSGQKNLVKVCRDRDVPRFLNLSSGAVYGRQPLDLERVDETWAGAPDPTDPHNSYHEGKRTAEMISSLAVAADRQVIVTARLFAFLAPFLPLDEHFAAGNFLRDALKGGPITLQSGGGSIRSYQYGTDMAVWLWALLARGRTGSAYNVGSDVATSLLDLARSTADMAGGGIDLDVRGSDSLASVTRYVPSVDRVRADLDVTNLVSLTDAIARTLRWYRLGRRELS